LEKKFNKEEILEFYLNQVPYAANRRGLVQAARYYFNRDLGTLNQKEMLTLVILVRAPSRYDLWKNTQKVEASLRRFVPQLVEANLIPKEEVESILSSPFDLEKAQLRVSAPHFVNYVKEALALEGRTESSLSTTLDPTWQSLFQKLLDERLQSLTDKKVKNGALLAVDHQSGEILAWVVAGNLDPQVPASALNTVTVLRQPGSALKPFLYALALEKGYTAATVLEDSPLIESVGMGGMHTYHNYSRHFYGPVTLREALGNSLNIPAVRTLAFVGGADYLAFLKKLGFQSLDQHSHFYGGGVALGNGEVSLLELVQAYSVLANGGFFRPLKFLKAKQSLNSAHQVLSGEVASLIAHILSDPKARAKEFGEFSVLNFAVQTAVKTGTSNDYRDAWAVGFNHRYTVGVWLGNLDQSSTHGLTGSTGPGLLLRSAFARLNQNQDTKPLFLHPNLRHYTLCLETKRLKQLEEDCPSYEEWFVPGTEPKASLAMHEEKQKIRLLRPVEGLRMAYDPRVPGDSQVFEFFLQGVEEKQNVIWQINKEVFKSQGGRYRWPLKKGEHVLSVSVLNEGETIYKSQEVNFLVK
ncbi:MAG: transglycosylase domain-containing protein, partial [Deltaproteobacteria bacterium]|nr:transglycosylase domain-containing protein [Deltaproteobacteria bacterium]